MGHIVGGFRANSLSSPEVSNLERGEVLVEEYIVRLDVSVDDVPAVDLF